MNQNKSSNKRIIKNWVGWSALVSLLLVQLWPVDRSMPQELGQDPFSQVGSDGYQLLRAACFDCHSYETQYPWYARVAPISMWLQGHIEVGRQELNFNEWRTLSHSDREHILEECIEEIQDGHMPLGSYTWMHPEARLDEDRRAILVTWLESQKRDL